MPPMFRLGQKMVFTSKMGRLERFLPIFGLAPIFYSSPNSVPQGNPVAMLEMTNASIPPPWASRVSGHHLSVGLLAAMESQEAEKAGGGNGTDQNRSAR
ncbi:hypothetical protein Q1695_007561 [Nippostrongylus brasiliensis]|nr:hypothetical protein Q1695_007561 [Nippostrongylus brasiliensis]